jgi:hypothetical protein
LLHQAMLPAIGTMAFLSHSRSVHLPFPYDKGSGGTRAAGQKFALLFAACEDGCQQTINRRPDVPSHREAQNARLLEGPC